jgi:SAM-dependent methyltransferase
LQSDRKFDFTLSYPSSDIVIENYWEDKIMRFFDILDIGEAELDILSPVSGERFIKLGEYLGLNSRSRVIDFGCGKGELLALWGKHFGVSGLGIDIRRSCATRAKQRLAEAGLDDRIEVIEGKATELDRAREKYDIAVCIAASYAWEGYPNAIAGMKNFLKPTGKIAIGEPHWIKENIIHSHCEKEPFFTEPELLEITREAGFDFEFMFRASREDIDNYEARHWQGFLRWIEANPDHPELDQIIQHLHKNQKEYFEFDRDNLGWAIYILNPIKYKPAHERKHTSIISEALAS